MNRLPTIIEGTFELPTGKVTEVGAASWFNWLESLEAKSFRFEGKCGVFTARKEAPKTGKPYWAAVRKISGQLRKSYLGKSEALTLERLEEIAAKLAELQPEKLGNSATKQATDIGNFVATSVTLPQEVTQQLQNQVAQLTMQLNRLQSELPSLIQSQVAAAIAQMRESKPSGEIPQLERLHSELTEARSHVENLSAQNRQIEKELDEARSQLADRQREIEDLELELENARAGEQMFRDEIAELRAEVEELTADSPHPWQCWAVNRQTGEERLVVSGATEKEVKGQALKIFASSVDAAFPVEKWQIVYRQQPASGSVPDYDALAATALASLKLGKQAPGYRAAAKAIAKFQELLTPEIPK